MFVPNLCSPSSQAMSPQQSENPQWGVAQVFEYPPGKPEDLEGNREFQSLLLFSLKSP